MLIGCRSTVPEFVFTTITPIVPTPITDVTELLAFFDSFEKRGTITEVLVPRHSFVHLTVFHRLLSASLAPRGECHTEF